RDGAVRRGRATPHRPRPAARPLGHAVPARGEPARLRRDAPPFIHGATRMSRIEILGLSKDYPTGFLHLKRVRALDGLSLTVEPGEIFGFLGGNGAGKTTAIKILMRLMTPTAGDVQIRGDDANDT